LQSLKNNPVSTENRLSSVQANFQRILTFYKEGSMKVLATVSITSTFLLALSLAAQQPSPAKDSQPQALGSITGHAFCADTGQPARFAGVQLLPDQPVDPLFSEKDIKEMGKSADFGKVMGAVMSAVMKGGSLTTMTTLDGSFNIDKVPQGTYYIIPQLPGYLSPLNLYSQKERVDPAKDTMKEIESQAQKITVAANQASHVEIRLERGASIGGTIRYDDGSPTASVTATLLLQQTDGKWKELGPSGLQQAASNDKGQYRISGLLPGKYAVKVALPTTQALMGLGAKSFSLQLNPGDALVVYSGDALREKEIKPIELGAGEDREDVNIVFPISGLHTVSGAVVAKVDGHAVNSGSVNLLDPETKGLLRTAMVDADGSFHFNYVTEGEYILQVSGAADTVKKNASAEDSDNIFSRLMNSKTVKSYGEATLPLTVKSDSTGLVVQVPNASDKKDQPQKGTPGDGLAAPARLPSTPPTN
jgi:hypothetical protein